MAEVLGCLAVLLVSFLLTLWAAGPAVRQDEDADA
jgi:hypothetical protein